MSEPESEQHIQRIGIPIEWDMPDTIDSRYVTNIAVQAGENEIFISFFEAQPPILTGTPEENLEILQQIKSIKARCVGRIVVAPNTLHDIIEALQTGLNLYHASKESQSE